MNWKAIIQHTTAPSLAAILLAFAMAPLPQIEGNPTGFKFFIEHYTAKPIADLWAQSDRVYDHTITGNQVQYLQYLKDEHLEVLRDIEDDCVDDNSDIPRCQFRLKRWEVENQDLDKKIDYMRTRESSEAAAIQMYAKHP